jgi:hypothetical protein
MNFLKKFKDWKIVITSLSNLLGFLVMLKYVNAEQSEAIYNCGVSILWLLSQIGILTIPNKNELLKD